MDQLAGAIIVLTALTIAGMCMMAKNNWDVSKSVSFWVAFTATCLVFAASFLYLAASP